MKKNNIIGVCSDLTSEGLGVIKLFNQTIFVPSILIGEKAEIEILYRGKGVAYGKIVRLIEKSQDRINPICSISSACGGCCFQNTTYEYELRFKKHKVEEALRKIGHIDFPVSNVIGAANIHNYRNKIQVPFAQEGKKIVYGFYKANTHRIIPVDNCNIEDERASSILKTVQHLMESMNISAYNEDNRSGIIRHILIRTSYHYDEIMVVLVCNQETFPSRNNFVKELVHRHPNIKTIIQNTNKRDTNVILGEQEKVLYGPGFIKDEILGVTFNISSKSFFQVHPSQTEVLYSKAFELAQLSKEDEVLDAYAGVGSIGAIASQYAKHVTSVEVVREAVDNMKENIKLNNIKNMTPVCEDCTKYLFETNHKFDVVILDPPRKGSTKEFLFSLLKNRPKKIIYISCDPATLARDLAYLINDYEIQTVQPVDMFPRSFHVETICGLYLKDNKK